MNHDITHCEGKSCPLKETCYRYAAYKEIYDYEKAYEVSVCISIFNNPPYKDGECEFYSKIK